MANIQVDASTGCWNWQLFKNDGYGRMWVGSRSDGTRRFDRAHRVAYRELVGPIPEGLELDHLCRNPSCVNPEHLEPVTSRTNLLRSEAPSAHQARQTHCKRGHEFTAENTYVDKKRKRYCIECRRLRVATYRRRDTEARASAKLVATTYRGVGIEPIPKTLKWRADCPSCGWTDVFASDQDARLAVYQHRHGART